MTTPTQRDIERWRFDRFPRTVHFYKSIDGEMVKYEDHLAHVEQETRVLRYWAEKLEETVMQQREQQYRDSGLSVSGARIHAEAEMKTIKSSFFHDAALANTEKQKEV